MENELYNFLEWLAAMICGLAFVAFFWPMAILAMDKYDLITTKIKSKWKRSKK